MNRQAVGSWIVKVEPRPGLLSTVNVAAHHLTEAPADREAKAHTAVTLQQLIRPLSATAQKRRRRGVKRPE
jgi:hypothetical protein